jgi:hypothetical protein
MIHHGQRNAADDQPVRSVQCFYRLAVELLHCTFVASTNAIRGAGVAVEGFNGLGNATLRRRQGYQALDQFKARLYGSVYLVMSRAIPLLLPGAALTCLASGYNACLAISVRSSYCTLSPDIPKLRLEIAIIRFLHLAGSHHHLGRSPADGLLEA